MIDIIKNKEQLLLRYQSGSYGHAWVDEKLKHSKEVTISKVFTFSREDLLSVPVSDDFLDTYPTLMDAEDSLSEQLSGESFSAEDDDAKIFILGQIEGEYYRIRRDIFGINHDLFLFKDMPLAPETFIAHRNISIFLKIDKLVNEPIIIGGNAEGAIPFDEFHYLLQNFPTTTELDHYASSRVTRILKDYFSSISDAQQKLTSYLEKRERRRTIDEEGPQASLATKKQIFVPYEMEKFEYVRDELKSMLLNAESYSEKAWQDIIINFLLLIFPKYIAVLPKLKVKDFYTNPQKTMNREIDITLVDAAGTIDVVEIKKPFAKCILSSGKYRDNYIPKKELAGSVMQVEKYLFHLSKWGYAGEKEILEKRKYELPNDFEIKITNPKGVIILGRDSDFAESQQWLDFEIIRRKYANMLDIITYDDLLRRLDNMITMLKRPAVAGEQGAQP